MIERTRGTRLALEALLGLTILRQRLGQKLQGNESLFRVQGARRDLTRNQTPILWPRPAWGEAPRFARNDLSS